MRIVNGNLNYSIGWLSWLSFSVIVKIEIIFATKRKTKTKMIFKWSHKIKLLWKWIEQEHIGKTRYIQFLSWLLGQTKKSEFVFARIGISKSTRIAKTETVLVTFSKYLLFSQLLAIIGHFLAELTTGQITNQIQICIWPSLKHDLGADLFSSFLVYSYD